MRSSLIILLCVTILATGAAVAHGGEARLTRPVVPGGLTSRGVPQTMWFQGLVCDVSTGEPLDTTCDIATEIYDSLSDGTSLWGPEAHNAVPVTVGWFSIELGSVESPLPSFDAPPYYLELTIDGETLSPRQKLASVPASLRAARADEGG
jgi:hypothetical protein